MTVTTGFCLIVGFFVICYLIWICGYEVGKRAVRHNIWQRERERDVRRVK